MRWFLLALWMPFAVQAEQVSEFVEANVLGIFYHEFGHAVIDIEGVPIFGQEEDAADVFSIYLIDAFYDEETAVSLAYDAAFGFLAEAEQAVADEVPWWDTHGPDEQRFYNTVCLFYGADPDGRKDFATDLELPEERAEFCQPFDCQCDAVDPCDDFGGNGAVIPGAWTAGAGGELGCDAE